MARRVDKPEDSIKWASGLIEMRRKNLRKLSDYSRMTFSMRQIGIMSKGNLKAWKLKKYANILADLQLKLKIVRL